MKTAPSDLRRLRWTVSRYHSLQGLGLAAVGAAVLTNAGLTGLAPDAYVLRQAVWLLVLAVALLLGRYYRRTFGQVRRSAAAVRRDVVTSAAWVALVLAMLVVPALTGWSTAPFLLAGGAVVSAWVLSERHLSGGFRPSEAILGAGLIVAGVLVAAGAPVSSWSDDTGFPGTSLAIGLALLTGGWLDHLALVRGLRAATATPQDA